MIPFPSKLSKNTSISINSLVKEIRSVQCTTYNKAIISENIALSNAAVSLEQLEHGVSTRVDGNVTNKYFGWHRCGSCNHQQNNTHCY